MRQRNLALTFAAFLLAASLSSLAALLAATSAHAACTAYRSDPAFLAELQTDDFLERVFPGVRNPASQAQLEQLRALARQKSPDHVGELAQLEGFWRQSVVTSMPFPMTVPVPFTLEIDPARHFVPELVRAEFDANGDGRPEWIGEGPAARTRYSHVYDREGEYLSTLRLHDRNGRVYVSSTRLRLVSAARFDAELKTVWADFKETLRRNDLTAALECIHTQSRARYKQSLEAIPRLSEQVEEIFGPIEPTVRQSGTTSYPNRVYQMLRLDGGVSYSYEVRFSADFDAVWRISSF